MLPEHTDENVELLAQHTRAACERVDPYHQLCLRSPNSPAFVNKS
jgi:hypothetical protein